MKETVQHYLDDFERLRGRDKYLSSQRLAAINAFRETGFPSSRQEDWKYTDVRPIAKKRFVNLSAAGSVHIAPDEIHSLKFQGGQCIDLVFINGVYSEACSNPDGLPEDVSVKNLADALGDHDSLLEEYLTRDDENKTNVFATLNTAFIQHGIYINVPQGVRIKKPINILYVTKDTGKPHVTHPRNLIVMGKHSEAILIENYVGLDAADYFTNTVTQIVLAENAILRYYKAQEESPKASHISNLNVRQDKNSRFESHLLSLGGALIRNDTHIRLTAEGAGVIMHGLYMTEDQQHIDNHLRVDHLSPHTVSVQNYRGVLRGKSRAVFNGKIVVHPQAQKTESRQNNANLLLSDDAEIDTKPELEIYADDVKCSHGATVGQLDQDMLFYLRTRAIDEATAKSLLTYTFMAEIIAAIDSTPIRNGFRNRVINKLPDAGLISEFVGE